MALALGIMKQLALLLFIPSIVHAEVMDKEPSLVSVWCWGAITATLLFVIARFRPRLLLVMIPLFALPFYGQLAEVTDPFVGPAILEEAGFIYIASSWVAPVVAFSGALAGLWSRRPHSATQ